MATVQPERMGAEPVNNLYTPAHTRELPKPFKPLKTIDIHMLYFEDLSYTSRGKIRLYMDPRGDIEFAIGVEDWMFNVIGGVRTRWQVQQKPKEIRVDQTTGVKYICGPTAKAVLESFHSLQNDYKRRKEMLGSQEYIAIHYTATAPKYGEDGQELEPPEEFRMETRRRNQNAELVEFSMKHYRGLLLKNDEGTNFYTVAESGELQSVTRYGTRDDTWLFLPYSEEAWASVLAVRRMLAQAADMMEGLFASTPEEFIRKMASGPLALPAPEAPPAPVKRITRTRR